MTPHTTDIWSGYRNDFPILEHAVYYDVAYKASVPTQVRAAVSNYFEENQTTLGDKVAMADRINRLRGMVATLIGAQYCEIAFTKNASEGLNLLAHSISYREGDNVVISDQEHAANELPWLNLCRQGVEVRKIKSRNFQFTTDDVADLIDRRTRVLSLSSTCQVSGFSPDLRGISNLCRRRGVLLFVDAIQSLGVRRLRVDEMEIDGLATSGHKWLLGPYGTGFLYANTRTMEHAKAIFASKHYSRLDRADPNTAMIDDAGRWEYGSLNYPGLFGLSAGIDMILSLGLERIEARTQWLVRQLRSQIERRGVSVITPRDSAGGPSGILSFAIDNARRIAERMRADGVYVSERKGVLRTSQHFYNDESDIKRFLTAL